MSLFKESLHCHHVLRSVYCLSNAVLLSCSFGDKYNMTSDISGILPQYWYRWWF